MKFIDLRSKYGDKLFEDFVHVWQNSSGYMEVARRMGETYPEFGYSHVAAARKVVVYDLKVNLKHFSPHTGYSPQHPLAARLRQIVDSTS